MLWPLTLHRKPVELPRESHRKIGNVDHLLHFAFAFSQNLSVFERNERAETVLVLSQFLADRTYDLAANRGGAQTPASEYLLAVCDDLFVLSSSGGLDDPQ
jgi:hypothetical protein